MQMSVRIWTIYAPVRLCASMGVENVDPSAFLPLAILLPIAIQSRQLKAFVIP